MAQTAERPRERARGRDRRPERTLYDQMLSNAKNENKLVRFSMAQEAYFTDGEDAVVTGLILKVDKFDILIEYKPQTNIWIKKSAIMGTEVLV